MADFTIAQEVRIKLPRFRKVLKLSSGQSVSSDAEVLAFAQIKVPIGKKATVMVNIDVIELEDE